MRPEERSASTSPFHCRGCGLGHPEAGFPHVCPACGGLYDVRPSWIELPSSWPAPGASPMQRFMQALPLPAGAPLATLGEGGTPLVSVAVRNRSVHLKCEHLNPTGSYKDRGTVVLTSALAAGQVSRVVEDSSGNAGASLAGYAARTGISARIFVPASASGPKREQIARLGAEIVAVPGPRSKAAEAVLEAVEAGDVYASHVFQPYALAGYATIAYELVEQLGAAPASVLLPVGHGSLLLGLYLGFEALRRSARATRLPRFIGVQASACAPIWAVFEGGAAGLSLVSEGETVAEGIRVRHPIRGDQVLAAVDDSKGKILAVEDEAILASRRILAQAGVDVEPTSAVIWPALDTLWDELEDPIVGILTGAGWKAPG